MKKKKRSYGQGRIWRRGRVWWISYCQNGVEQRESSKSGVHAVALDLLRRRLGEQQAGTLLAARARTLTVRDALTLLEADYEEKGRHSIPALKGHIAAWNTAMGDVEVANVDYPLLDEQARAWLRDHDATAATINRRMASLRRAVRLAVRRKLAARPVEVPHLDEAPPREGFLPPADFAALVAALPDDGLSLFVRFLYTTGMRVGEARQLEWRDVDGAVLRIRGETAKNKVSRTLPIRGAVETIVTEARTLRRLDCARIFHRDGLPIGDFRKAWRTAAKAASHPEVRPHDLRRSAVRNLIRSGVPERIAMGITGHKTRSVFDRYNIVSASDLGAALDTVGAYLDSAATSPTVKKTRAIKPDRVSESRPSYHRARRKIAV